MTELMKLCFREKKKSPELHLITAYIFYYRLKNKYRALYEISKALSYTPSLSIHFSIYRFTKIVEFDLQTEDERLTEERGVDYNSLVYFNNGFATFQRLIMSACKYHRKMIEEVQEKTPDVLRIYTYGHRLMKEKAIIKKKFDELFAISPNHLKNLELYAKFLENVLNDAESASTLQERTVQIVNKQFESLKNSSEFAREKYEINSKTGIVVVSGDTNNLGIIFSANNLMEDLYGFPESELIGHNISKLVPEYYRTIHQTNFEEFFEREEEARPILASERVVYPINKRDFLVPSSIMIKSLPEIAGSIKLVGFMTPLNRLSKNPAEDITCGMIIEADSGMLYGITQNCQDLFGISKNLVHNKKNEDFRLEEIMPDLYAGSNFKVAQTGEVVVKLNTTKLKSENGVDRNEESFDRVLLNQLDDLDKESHGYEDGLNDKKFKEVAVKVKLIPIVEKEEDTYFLSFTAANEKLYDDMDYFTDQKENDFKDMVKQDNHIRQNSQQGNKGGMPDDKRRLQEFFSSIKDKDFPKSIKTMIRLYVFSIMSILVVAVIAFYFNVTFKTTNDEALAVTKLSHVRSNLIPQIIYYCQVVSMLADGYYDAFPQEKLARELQAKSNITYLVNLLQHVNVDAVNYQIKMDKATGRNSKDQQYSVSLLLSNNETKVFQKDFNDALLQFVTSSSLIQNETLANWKLDLINSPLRDYFYNNENGLKVLRAASDDTTQLFYDFYSKSFSSFSLWLYIQLGLIIFILFLTIFTLICTHVRLLRIYKQVTVFFGMMTLDELKLLKASVEAFQTEYLKNVEDIDSEDEDNQADPVNNVDEDEEKREQNVQETKIKYDDPNKDLQELDADNEEQRLVRNAKRRMSKIPKKEVPLEESDEDEEVVEDAEIHRKNVEDPVDKMSKTDLNRSLHLALKHNDEGFDIRMQAMYYEGKLDYLRNKQGIYAKIPYFWIIFDGILLVSLFTITLWQSFDYLINLRVIYPMHQALGQRIPNSQYLVDLSTDTILNGTYMTYNNVNLFEKYMENIEELEDRINALSKNTFSSNFNDFFTTFENFSLHDLCAGYKAITSNDLIVDGGCAVHNNDILTKGESISIISTINYARELVLEYLRDRGNITSAADIKALKVETAISTNMQVLEDIVSALNKTMSYEIASFQNAWQRTNNNFTNLSIPLFACLIVYLILTLINYLLKALSTFRKRVMYNKGLLSLVPQHLILQNNNLKEHIFEGDLRDVLE